MNSVMLPFLFVLTFMPSFFPKMLSRSKTPCTTLSPLADVNLVNLRREFFHVTLDEIEACVKQNFSETVEFTRTATAQEYRESETIRAEQALAS